MEDRSFGIISEGPSDQIVLEHILYGITGNKSLSVTRLQPNEDAPGNWDKVFKYCASEEFKEALAYLDFLIVHLDTDILVGDNIPKDLQINTQGLSVEEILLLVREKLIGWIGENFYTEFQQQIIFAIAVDSIECWFLPIYFGNDKKKSNKNSGCINALNTVLLQREGFTIDEKRLLYYERISKHFLKAKDLEKYADKNQSLSGFLAEFKSKTKQ